VRDTRTGDDLRVRAFACPRCRGLVFFDNSACLTCGATLGYVRQRGEFAELVDGVCATPDGDLRACDNRERIGCNWLTDLPLCGCCELTRTRPADSDTDGMTAWARTEAAKRRLLFQLDSLGRPPTPKSTAPDTGLAFDLLSSANEPVTTGHADGVITIDLAEGDDPHREAMRVRLDEPYRTLLGHLRHEVGHYYWQRLVDGTPSLPEFRVLFGDERADYTDALRTHYERPDDRSWSDTRVSHYAAAHPWEDWAETFAQYLHIRDTTQTAAAWGMRVEGPDLDLAPARDATVAAEPTEDVDTFADLIRTWIPLSFALNAVNRSMGKDDLYPFLLPPPVLRKLRFVHDRITG
jgi:hypothetical protein